MDNRYFTVRVDDAARTITHNFAEAIAGAVNQKICPCVVWSVSVSKGDIEFCMYGDWDQYTAARKIVRRLGRGKVRFRLLAEGE